MQKHSCFLIYVVGSLIGLGALSATPASAQNRHSTPDAAQSIAVVDNRFGFRLFAAVHNKDADANVCLSPTSIALALQMSYNGANGTTKTGMAQALQLGNLSLAQVNTSSKALLDSLLHTDTNTAQAASALRKPAPILAIANSLWFADKSPVKPAFTQCAQTYYQAQVNNLQGVPQTINAWVSQHTHAKITEIVTARDLQNADAVLVNAVYFKGTWQTPFEKSLTQNRPFHLANASVQNCRMMTQKGLFYYSETDTFQMVSLPYSGDRLDMVLMLPREGKKLRGLLSQLTPETWKQWTDGMKLKEGNISLPHFRSEYSVTLNEVLASLGMGQAFQPGADFSNMMPGGSQISKVLHKTFVEVNEEGTEAAAATAVVHGKGMAKMSFRMVLDRPFVYAIRDRQTGALLFLGTLAKPTS